MLGQTVISSLGTSQYFAYIVASSTRVNLVLKPRLFSVELTISASCSAGSPFAPTIVDGFPAGVLAARVAGELDVLFGDRHVAFGVFVEVHLGPG